MAAMSLVGCHRSAPLPEDLALGKRYVEDARFRRQVLEQSLVNPENDYSRLRLARYREEDWGALPEWNPPVANVTADGMSEYRTLNVDAVPWERTALLTLGREAFFRYPVQLQEALRIGLKHPDIYGLWRIPDSLGGAVREQVAVGPPRLAVTCATCHAMPGRDGQLVEGLPNAKLDLGAMLADTFPSKSALPLWGPGRVDLANDGLDNPIAISDLRAVRSEQYLHHDATVRNGLVELAIRIETLIITSNHWTLRPPRKIAFALALYLWQLQPKAVGQESDGSARGEKVFRRSCAGCHKPPEYSGDRIALAKVGTDPIVGISSDRAPLLASGQVPGIEALMDPARTAKGHRYGLELSPEDRSDLLAFLRTLQ
jgi:mono/diheme cytochrome c family protein